MRPLALIRGSFRAKVAGAALLTTGLALLLALSLFFFRQWMTEREDLIENTTVSAEVIGDNLGASLVFRDSESARQILTSARAIPDFAAGHLYDADGRLFAHLHQAGEHEPRPSGASAPEAAYVNDGLEVHVPVRVDGARVGELVLTLGLDRLHALLWGYAVFTLLLLGTVAGAATIVAFLVANRVIDPVRHMFRALAEVRRTQDYSRRVETVTQDELGQLTDAFNGFLDQLDRNDAELRRTMDELVVARDQAEKASIMKSQFLANMSHEIRTPLNGVLGMAEVMARDELADTQRERLEVVRRSGRGLLFLLNDLLDLSKIEAGRLELECEDFDLGGVVHAAVDTFATVAREKGLAFEVEIAPAARGVWRGDGARVRQIVANLVSNAVKFTRQGQVSVTVGRETRDAGEVMCIVVRDSGIGIPANKLPLLFDKFAQADTSTTREFGGSGLGLSISRELARMMEGEISAESGEGEGSTFIVRLPLPFVREGAAAVPAEARHDAVHSLEAAHSPINILVAEDNATNQLVLKAMLEPFDMRLQIVGDGAQAVEAWSREHFDLVLMDVQMPVMDGVAATRTIRDLEGTRGRGRTPIVALTANAMKHQVEEYLAVGMDGHVAKPIEAAALYEMIDRVLEAEPVAVNG